MKKFSVLIALALLAVAGTGYAVTCAYDNVPAATLLVPHFRVGRQGSTGQDIPAGGVDTLCSVTNVSATGVIVHVTVWNKYSKAVLDFNVPLTAYDVAYWSMRTVLNGNLNVNPTVQDAALWTDRAGNLFDPCGVNQTTAQYGPYTDIGFGGATFIRFPNPDSSDAIISISIYPAVAFSGSFRGRVWDSLDEVTDVISLTDPTSQGILDKDNPACSNTDQFGNGQYANDFGGYLTLDVVNYCTNWFPDQAQFYTLDAIATNGWGAYGYTPNAIMGDVFYVDLAVPNGNVSGDPMVALEFDSRLNNWVNQNTFFGRYYSLEQVMGTSAPANYQFLGDGREPLGSRYGFRFLNDASAQYNSWAIVWRSDLYVSNASVGLFNAPNLCTWWSRGGRQGEGMYDGPHVLVSKTFDNDENSTVTSGGPSGGATASPNYVFLESQRIRLSSNGDFNPMSYKGGWSDWTLPGSTRAAHKQYQAYVGIQHSGNGLALSVGHSATNLVGDFNCDPNATSTLTGITGTGVLNY